jgi:hypothetical protein
MSNTNVEDLSREDLLRILQRDRFVKEQLASRIGSLMHENVELLGVIQELQASQASAPMTAPHEPRDIPHPDPSGDVTS